MHRRRNRGALGAAAPQYFMVNQIAPPILCTQFLPCTCAKRLRLALYVKVERNIRCAEYRTNVIDVIKVPSLFLRRLHFFGKI